MSSFEDDFLRERLADLQKTNPREAQLAKDLIAAIAFDKGKTKDSGMAGHMVFTLCQKLAKDSERGLRSLTAWLGQFVKEGSLEQAKADTFIAKAQAICDAKSH